MGRPNLDLEVAAETPPRGGYPVQPFSTSGRPDFLAFGRLQSM
jgi:hypothetical protein